MDIWTIQQHNQDQRSTDEFAYIGWNKAYKTLSDAQNAIRTESEEIAESSVDIEWVEIKDGRWVGIVDGDPIDGLYAIVRATID